MADTTAVDLRTTLGAAELPRDVLRVAGPEAVDYLQGQLSQDVAGLAAGASAWSFLLQPTGKVDAWLRVTRTGDDAFVLDVDAGYGEAVVARLRRFLLRTKAEVDMLPWRAVALRGPGADRVDGLAGLVVATWPGVAGVDVLGEDAAVPAGVERATAADLASLRVRAGIPAMGAELSEATIPAEAGRHVVDASVSFTKGCYTGQELVARIDSRGGNVPRRVRGLVLPDTAGVAPGAAVVVDGDEVGRVTSVAPAPGGGAVALALVKRAVEPPARGEVRAADGTVAAEVVTVPFQA
ncbi:MAG TPA: glycine cleavage T C-terminal barrel domain-containing protein [Acidimicrobiales bacterium]|jgi:folate-binding protein YgfZ|nr:glycine cleavage T C-terminal barrel domain-containing protein [Acidimicrobiales bacterium]